MQEEILQFVWGHKLFNHKHLKTNSGEEIIILNQGSLNTIAGPDFIAARIRIGDHQWAGNVEIHSKSSDWFKHGHQNDKAYNNVILHVVFDHDMEVSLENGEQPFTLSLNGIVPKHIFDNYLDLKSNKASIPCSDQLKFVPNIVKEQWKNRLLIERLERKSTDVLEILKESNGDWLQTFYSLFSGYLGQNTNKQPFRELAQILPLKLLLKYQDNRLQIEAMLFGVANLIPEKDDDYAEALKKEYAFLKQKHELTQVHSHWIFGGVRPQAMPYRRVAFLAAAVETLGDFRSSLINDLKINFFDSLELSEYWKRRYVFGIEPKSKVYSFGDSFKLLIHVNVLAPYIYGFGVETDQQELKDRAIDLLETNPPEKNAIITKWSGLGEECVNAAESQALIELKTSFCNLKKCVLCNIGKSILSIES